MTQNVKCRKTAKERTGKGNNYYHPEREKKIQMTTMTENIAKIVHPTNSLTNIKHSYNICLLFQDISSATASIILKFNINLVK